jgi:D(-)-tartrate dehydratase
MRIVDIRECAVPLKSDISNSSFDFSEMTTSVVAVITDVMREGRPVVGFASSGQIRDLCSTTGRRISIRKKFSPS